MSDTIAALATPPGRGGVAIIRVSGPLVETIVAQLLLRSLKPREATYVSFLDVAGKVIDEGIAIFFPHPHSFTGEDVIELHTHGSPIVIDLLLERLIKELGARLARPGEFSERAFLNGKMDLTQAEAIADLINASSAQAARSAIRSLQGEFSKEIFALNERVIRLRTYVEAAIDFADEEIDFLNESTLVTKLNALIDTLNHIQHKAKQGSFFREGIVAVIIGEPNVGKSSLLNKLSGKDVAIVTDIPGTTRDIIRHPMLIDGMPLHIIDTAGLRDSEDRVEQEGIRRAYEEIKNADIILYVIDAGVIPSDHLFQTIHYQDKLKDKLPNVPVIAIRNKIDLINEMPSIVEKENQTTISLSVKTGMGLDLLHKVIKTVIGFESESDGIYLARRRHLDALARCKQHFMVCLSQLIQVKAAELAAEELRLAQQALAEITGEFSSEDLLGRIFSTFCIGK